MGVIPRRFPLWPLVGLALLVVPVIEIAVIVAIGDQIGIAPTLIVMLTASGVGAWLMTREGPRAWRALLAATRAGQLPHRELVDGALVMAGAALLLTPGFVTDVVGLALLLPVTRSVVRRGVTALMARRLRRTAAHHIPGMSGFGAGPGTGPGARPGAGYVVDVVAGEVVRHPSDPR